MSTKAYGEGSVYQIANGTWRATMRVNGKTKYFSGRTEREVKKKLKDFKANPMSYAGASISNADTAAYFRQWLDTRKKPVLKAASYDRLDGVLRNYIIPHFSGLALTNVTPEDCSRLLVELQQRGLSYSTTKKVHDTMHDCFRNAVERRDLQYSPLATVRMPHRSTFSAKQSPKSERHLTADEVEALCSELDRKTGTGKYVYRYRNAFILGLHTGLREGELIALDWDDVNWDKRELMVRKTAVMVQKRNKSNEIVGGVKQVIQNTPKTSKSDRIVPLNQTAWEALLELKQQAGESPYVLPTQTGARLLISSFGKQYGNVMRRCGIEGSSPHALRHTFATRLFEKGADVKTVSTLLGHSSVAVTYNTYIHVIEDRKNEVVALLD